MPLQLIITKVFRLAEQMDALFARLQSYTCYLG